MPSQVLQHQFSAPVRVVNRGGKHPCVLVCEHASHHIPARFQGLGLSGAALTSHIAWDPGALDTALALSERLDAPLVHGTVSRLVYDCNRPPSAPSAIVESSEGTVIPGNQGLTAAQRAARADAVYRPFDSCLSGLLAERSATSVLVTLHSFTPVYFGEHRSVEVGILHDSDARLADAMLAEIGHYVCARNQPYGPEDGVTHTLLRHALPSDLLNVMIEIRNDLIASPEQVSSMADSLETWLTASLAQLNDVGVGGTR